jgi:hypothetical protein
MDGRGYLVLSHTHFAVLVVRATSAGLVFSPVLFPTTLCFLLQPCVVSPSVALPNG